MDDEAIRALLTRLARPHASGGTIVARAAVMAEGGDFDEVMTWITDHGGVSEEVAAGAPSAGLHGARMDDRARTHTARRFVLPPDALRGGEPGEGRPRAE